MHARQLHATQLGAICCTWQGLHLTGEGFSAAAALELGSGEFVRDNANAAAHPKFDADKVQIALRHLGLHRSMNIQEALVTCSQRRVMFIP